MRLLHRTRAALAILLVFAQLAAVVALQTPVSAAVQADFEITGITVENADAGAIQCDSRLAVEVYWKLSDPTKTIGSGDTFTFTLPSDVADNAAMSPLSPSNPAGYPIFYGTTSDIIGYLTVDGRTLTATFNDYMGARMNVSGMIYFEAQLSFESSAEEKTYTLSFTANGTSEPFTITVGGDDTEDPGEDPAQLALSKSATAYDYGTDRISWSLDINSQLVGSPTSLMSVVDSIPAKQSYVPGTLVIQKAGGEVIYSEDASAPVSWPAEYSLLGAAASASASQISLSLPAGERYKATFQTQVQLEEGEIPGSYSNSATVTLEGYPAVTGRASITPEKISKSAGVYDVANDEIDWTIHINRRRVTHTDNTAALSVRDVIGEGHSYKDGTLAIYRVDGSTETWIADQSSPNVSINGNEIVFALPQSVAKEYYIMRYSTTITNVGATQYGNTAYLRKDGGNVQTSSNHATLNKFSKTCTGYNAAERKLTWRIDVNAGKKANLTELRMTDEIGLGHELIADSVKISHMVGSTMTEISPSEWQSWSPAPELSATKIDILFPGSDYYRVEYATRITATAFGNYYNKATMSATYIDPIVQEVAKATRSGGGYAGGDLPATTVTINKKSGDRMLAGVVFELLMKDGSTEVVLGTYTTDPNGQIVITGLPPAIGGIGGVYYLREVSGPAGYIPLTELTQFTIASATSSVTVNIENYPIELTIHKHYGSLGLGGVKFDLFDAQNVKYGSYVTDQDGYIRITTIPNGVYTLVETQEKPGYRRLSAPISITVDNVCQQVDVENVPNVVKIYKHYGSLALPGVEFDLYDANNVKYGSYVTDQNGFIEISTIPNGVYRLYETKAFPGYQQLAAPVIITVDNADQQVDVVNYPIVNGGRPLTIRKLVESDADVGKPFTFELRIAGGSAIPITLAGAKSAETAATYVVTLPIGTAYEVKEVFSAADQGKYSVTVNGSATSGVSGSITSGVNEVTFLNKVNASAVAGLEGDEVIEIGDTNANQIPKTADQVAKYAFGVALMALLAVMALYLHSRARLEKGKR